MRHSIDSDSNICQLATRHAAGLLGLVLVYGGFVWDAAVLLIELGCRHIIKPSLRSDPPACIGADGPTQRAVHVRVTGRVFAPRMIAPGGGEVFAHFDLMSPIFR